MKKENAPKLYDNPWYYNEQPLTEIPDGMQGFVYMITNLMTDRKYIGRKYFYAKRKPAGKKRKVTIESNWRNYYGSCQELNEDISLLGKDMFKREILCLCETRGETNYKEIEYQFLYNVLRETNENGERMFYNGNIMSRYFAAPNELSEDSRQQISETLKKYYRENEINDETRKKISNANKNAWARLSEEERNQRIEKAAAWWANLTEEDRKEISKRESNISEEERESRRQRMKNWWDSLSEEAREEYFRKRSETYKNKSKEWKEAFGKSISERKKGQIVTQEHRDKISKTLTGRKAPPEQIEKMKGRTPWNKGISKEEWKARLGDSYKIPPGVKGSFIVNNGTNEKRVYSESEIPNGYTKGRLSNIHHTKKVKVTYQDGTIEIYDSISNLLKKLNMTKRTLERLKYKYDDPEYLKRKKTFLNIYKCEY